MKRLWNILIYGHWHLHEYEIVKEEPYSLKIIDHYGSSQRSSGTSYTLKCKHCGNMKNFQTKVLG